VEETQSTNKTDCHDITEIFLKVVFKTIKQANKPMEKKYLQGGEGTVEASSVA
jgi:hypothetical protein